MSKTKYTKELLEPIVNESISLAQVITKLDLKLTGGNYVHIKKRIYHANLDISHFLGKGANCGDKHKGGPDKKNCYEILVLNEGNRREAAFRLRRALVEYGREYKCEECNLDVWFGKEIKLHVDHIDGNWLDNRPSNVRFLCPNCHSQTDNHSGSKGLTDLFTNARQNQEARKRKQRQ